MTSVSAAFNSRMGGDPIYGGKHVSRARLIAQFSPFGLMCLIRSNLSFVIHFRVKEKRQVSIHKEVSAGSLQLNFYTTSLLLHRINQEIRDMLTKLKRFGEMPETAWVAL